MMHYLKQLSLVIFSFVTVAAFAQNVGIGTNNPNSSAILDVSSSNKGILLPRVDDTSKVNNPAAGLIIYSESAKAPNYFDGNKWNDVADARNNFVPVHGSIKYIMPGAVTIGGIKAATGPLDAIEYVNGIRTPYTIGASSGPVGAVRGMDSVIMSKEFDANSIYFKRAHLAGSTIPSIEILHYMPGASSPFYSVKLSDVRLAVQSFYISEETGKMTEQFSFIPLTVGYKDWINNYSFSFNIATRNFGTY